MHTLDSPRHFMIRVILVLRPGKVKTVVRNTVSYLARHEDLGNCKRNVCFGQ